MCLEFAYAAYTACTNIVPNFKIAVILTPLLVTTCLLTMTLPAQVCYLKKKERQKKNEFHIFEHIYEMYMKLLLYKKMFII